MFIDRINFINHKMPIINEIISKITELIHSFQLRSNTLDIHLYMNLKESKHFFTRI